VKVCILFQLWFVDTLVYNIHVTRPVFFI